MTAESTILQGREMAESLMTSTCTIGVTEESVHPVTFETITTVIETHYTGPCRLRFPGSTVSELDAGSQRITDQTAILSIPVGNVTIRTDDGGEILTNPLDPSLVGTKFRISGDHSQTYATARRFPVEITS